MTNTVEELMTEIAKAFYRELENAVSGIMTIKMVIGYSELQAAVYDENGNERWIAPKADFTSLFEKLREAMNKANPDHGAWYIAKLTIDAKGKYGYDFDYDDIAQFDLPPTEEELAQDLRQFPRTGK